ncbi:MAG: hypothetical protein AAFU85_22915 [Planctomycetota bacterium]
MLNPYEVADSREYQSDSVRCPICLTECDRRVAFRTAFCRGCGIKLAGQAPFVVRVFLWSVLVAVTFARWAIADRLLGVDSLYFGYLFVGHPMILVLMDACFGRVWPCGGLRFLRRREVDARRRRFLDEQSIRAKGVAEEFGRARRVDER